MLASLGLSFFLYFFLLPKREEISPGQRERERERRVKTSHLVQDSDEIVAELRLDGLRVEQGECF